MISSAMSATLRTRGPRSIGCSAGRCRTRSRRPTHSAVPPPLPDLTAIEQHALDARPELSGTARAAGGRTRIDHRWPANTGSRTCSSAPPPTSERRTIHLPTRTSSGSTECRSRCRSSSGEHASGETGTGPASRARARGIVPGPASVRRPGCPRRIRDRGDGAAATPLSARSGPPRGARSVPDRGRQLRPRRVIRARRARRPPHARLPPRASTPMPCPPPMRRRPISSAPPRPRSPSSRPELRMLAESAPSSRRRTDRDCPRVQCDASSRCRGALLLRATPGRPRARREPAQATASAASHSHLGASVACIGVHADGGTARTDPHGRRGPDGLPAHDRHHRHGGVQRRPVDAGPLADLRPGGPDPRQHRHARRTWDAARPRLVARFRAGDRRRIQKAQTALQNTARIADARRAALQERRDRAQRSGSGALGFRVRGSRSRGRDPADGRARCRLGQRSMRFARGSPCPRCPA